MTSESTGPQHFAIGTPPVPKSAPEVASHRGEGAFTNAPGLTLNNPDRGMEEGRTQEESPPRPVFTWADSAAWGRENLPRDAVPERDVGRRRRLDADGQEQTVPGGIAGRPEFRMPYSCGFQDSMYGSTSLYGNSGPSQSRAAEGERPTSTETPSQGIGPSQDGGVPSGGGSGSDQMLQLLLIQQQQTQKVMEALVNRMDTLERNSRIPPFPQGLQGPLQQPCGYPVQGGQGTSSSTSCSTSTR